MLSKQELDDIWENKPYGYFTQLKKTLASKEKLNKYKITARQFKIEEVELATAEEEVYAKNQDAYQVRDAITRLQNKLTKSNGFDVGKVIRYEKKLLTSPKK